MAGSDVLSGKFASPSCISQRIVALPLEEVEVMAPLDTAPRFSSNVTAARNAEGGGGVGNGKDFTCPTPIAFICRTSSSREVIKISGGLN
jgi:hypothetical protein